MPSTKTRKSVEDLVDTVMEPINKVPVSYVAILLGDFVDGTYLPFVESKRKPSTLRGYKQMWQCYLKPRFRCTSLLLHNTETRNIQSLLDETEREEHLAAKSMAHLKHFLSRIYRYAIGKATFPLERRTLSHPLRPHRFLILTDGRTRWKRSP